MDGRTERFRCRKRETWACIQSHNGSPTTTTTTPRAIETSHSDLHPYSNATQASHSYGGELLAFCATEQKVNVEIASRSGQSQISKDRELLVLCWLQVSNQRPAAGAVSAALDLNERLLRVRVRTGAHGGQIYSLAAASRDH